SRRRHTRSYGDWSSDVCSSDLGANATVTVAHSRTRDLAERCREADVLVVAIGRAELVRGDWVRPGAAVVDVGQNRSDERLVGDRSEERRVGKEGRERGGSEQVR